LRCFAPRSNKPALRFAIGGSWASTAFGEPRFTNDVDILADFTAETLDAFLDRLPDDRFACAGLSM
jgi:hypothetical protein